MGQRADEIGGARSLGDTELDNADYASTDMAAGAGYAGGLTGMPYSEGDPELFTEQVDAGVGYDANVDTDADQPDDILQTRAQIENTRSEMSGTIDAIQEKLSPGNIARQAKETVRDATIGKAQDMVSNATDSAQEVVSNATDSARGFGSSIVETIRENPIPAALAGIGIGWLFMSSRNSSSSSSSSSSYGYAPGRQYDAYGYTRQRDWDDQYRSYGYEGNQGQGLTDKASDLAGKAQDSVSNVAGQVQGTVSGAAGQVQDTASQVAGQVQDTAGQIGYQAQQGMQQARSGFQRMMDSNPLAVGVIAIGAGAAIGLAIPETQTENQLMGEQRDQLMSQAQDTAQSMAQKAQTVAQQAAGAAKDAAQSEAQNQGLTEAGSSGSSNSKSKQSS